MRKGNYGSAASPLPSARRRLDANARAAAETRLLCALPPSIDSRRCGTGAPLPSAPMRSADAEESRTSGMRRRCCVCVMGRAESKTRGAEEVGTRVGFSTGLSTGLGRLGHLGPGKGHVGLGQTSRAGP
ncbi:Os02g0561600 [Oryza sativa Japonica Group]|uniref:Os02g0559600 protein n=2 Tax=Oryza sativa subsp. japonica TaxID=39947 RepID=B9F0K8_ORYSJ|nr:hypothetical protein OsJ_07153 [Oryza sativa Japonica Group]BAS79248.1 Os02g0559600 [Oryza sativa Japonica Group]BAS79252.1 Os02g0560000 [Oryza sativa Japonica Group]BAS79256.1 Os02g0560400 [Oryza sativa Japonica Group]BAS79260.1 Os02g0560800 [Oryza sativa Japonica Group]